MAMSNKPDGNNPKKADVILQNEREIYARQMEANAKIDSLTQRVDNAMSQISSARKDSAVAARQNTEIYISLKDEYAKVKQEIRYLAKQNENIYTSMTEVVQDLAKEVMSLKDTIASGVKVSEVKETVQPVQKEVVASQLVLPEAYAPKIDYDVLAEKVSQMVLDRMPVQEVISPDYIASKIAEQIIIPPATVDSVDLSNAKVDINAEELADRISLKLGALRTDDFDILVDDEGCASIAREVSDLMNYDLISAAVAEKLRAELDLIHIGDPDYDYLSTKVAEKINTVNVNEEVIAEKTAAVVAKYLPEIDTDDIADKVVRQVLSAMPESEVVVTDAEGESQTQVEETSYDIYIDDDGIETIAGRVTEKVLEGTSERFENVDAGIADIKEKLLSAGLTDEQAEEISAKVAELVSERLPDEIKVDTVAENVSLSEEQVDTISNKVADILVERLPQSEEKSAEISEEQIDTISNKVADILTERMPQTEEKTAEISEEQLNAASERVAQIVIERMPAPQAVVAGEQVVSSELTDEQLAEISNKVADLVIDRMPESKVVENITGVVAEYDDKTVEDISERVTEKVTINNSERFDKIESDIAEIKDILNSGVVVSKESVIAEEAIEPEEEQLVTVSEIVSESEEALEQEPEVIEEVAEEPEAVVEEEVIEEKDEVIEEIVEDINEEVTSDEEMPDGIEDGEGGVDFANMMKYNRSYIARIIQGTNEQKYYYGAVKDALLSYKRVNSNIAWGAERFNKGRETIARFKIRGKTLCLYLALDPNEYKQSVYHHVDVSDNKSMAGTPMMVKIKSEMGVKKAVRLINEMLEKRNGEQRIVPERDYVAMYPYESIEELIEDGLVKDVRKNK